MYPTRLNLLSPEKRNRLQKMIYVQFIKNVFISVVFVFCLSGITLLGGQWVLQEYFNAVSNNILSANSQQAEKNKKINEVNSIITNIGALQEVNTLWHPTIIRLINSIPAGITLDSISLNSSAKTFIISGVARAREDLLTMQINLSTLDFVENIDIPLSQLTKKENFSFSITATFK